MGGLAVGQQGRIAGDAAVAHVLRFLQQKIQKLGRQTVVIPQHIDPLAQRCRCFGAEKQPLGSHGAEETSGDAALVTGGTQG